MKITDIKTNWVKIPRVGSTLLGVFDTNTPYKEIKDKDIIKKDNLETFCYSCIVQVFTDEGFVGLGECEEPIVNNSIMDTFKKNLIGENVYDIQELINNKVNYSIHNIRTKQISAIEIALWDIIGKKAGLPIYTLMGGKVRKKVAITLFAGIKPVDKTISDVENAVSKNIKTIKLKVGRNDQRDIGIVKEIRNQFGWDLKLRVDPNGAWSFPDAASMIKKMSKYDIQYVEGPLQRWNWQGLKRLKELTGVPICICEGLNRDGVMNPGEMISRLMDLIKNDAIDVISTEPVRSGGILGFKKVCALCESAGIEVVTHWPRAGITQSAWIHSCVSNIATQLAQDIVPTGFIGGPLDDIIKEPINIENGCVKPPEGPGLGVEIDKEKIKKYSIQES